MKKDYITRMSKKIRNKLIFYTYTELKIKSKKNHDLLINSMTSNMLSEKYQKHSDYCVEKIEEYSSNVNYFYVSVTYCSVSNNYQILVDNKNIAGSIIKVKIF